MSVLNEYKSAIRGKLDETIANIVNKHVSQKLRDIETAIGNVEADLDSLKYHVDDKEQEFSHEVHAVQDTVNDLDRRFDDLEQVNGEVSQEDIDTVKNALSDIHQATAYL